MNKQIISNIPLISLVAITCGYIHIHSLFSYVDIDIWSYISAQELIMIIATYLPFLIAFSAMISFSIIYSNTLNKHLLVKYTGYKRWIFSGLVYVGTLVIFGCAIFLITWTESIWWKTIIAGMIFNGLFLSSFLFDELDIDKVLNWSVVMLGIYILFFASYLHANQMGKTRLKSDNTEFIIVHDSQYFTRESHIYYYRMMDFTFLMAKVDSSMIVLKNDLITHESLKLID